MRYLHLQSSKQLVGSIDKWNSRNKDGMALKMYVVNGLVEGYSAKEDKDKYPQFQKYTTRILGSAPTNARRTHANVASTHGPKNSKSPTENCSTDFLSLTHPSMLQLN
jgi:hypothetical protein